MSGIEMTPEDLEDWKNVFADIEESINLVMQNGEDL